jgi:hypothetical protein
MWTCGVCETVNHGGRSCTACGAPLTRRSAVTTSVRDRLAPVPPPVADPLPEPVERAINRTPVPADEWEAYDTGPRIDVRPLPGGCLFVVGPRGPT